MASKSRLLILVALLLIPSALFVGLNSDVPKFCYLHDDCLYFVSAKSMADGGGYRIASLPGEPPQTKYPPLYPLVLSLAWRLVPEFPANLTPAVWISWLALPAMLFLLGRLYPRMGFDGWKGAALLGLLAANPFTITFSGTLLSELLFVAFLAGCLLLTEKAVGSPNGEKWAAAAGVVMGLGYLTRSAGIVSLVALPLFFLIRRRWKHAAYFAAAMLPFVAGWMTWVKLHQASSGGDPALMYYIDYTGYQIYNVSFSDLHLLLWKNIDGLVWAFGSLAFSRISDSLFLKILAEVIGVAMISGVIRMVRRGNGLAYGLFALGSCLLLIIWHFPPNERFVYPMFPLALAGLWTELEHLTAMLRAGFQHQDRSQRVAAGFILTAVGLVFGACLVTQGYMDAVFMPEDARQYRAYRDAQREAYAWTRQQTPESALVLAQRDPLFYLETGRHAISRPIPPMHWYHDDRKAVVDSFRTLAPFARAHKLDYVYYAGADFGWAVDPSDRSQIDEAVRNNPELSTRFRKGDAAVYTLQPARVLAGN